MILVQVYKDPEVVVKLWVCNWLCWTL